MRSSPMTERIDRIDHKWPRLNGDIAVKGENGEPIYDVLTPEQEILRDLGRDIDKIDPTGNDLLLAVYVRPTTKTIIGVGGRATTIDLSASGRETEDKYQGKVCYVLKHGPGVSESSKWFKGGVVPPVGSWVLVPIAKRSQFLMGIEENGFKTRHVAVASVESVEGVLTDPDCFL